ncbi:MAG: hypothetical protein A3K19_28555 [Lentisphaerae bacterium RIFOXYB12_FULL_65_16]|nr:MAG: hypothetical protein A3K18_32000 [Lentisphaerae bacterium RIFOXYA12_64_32]OGV90892.1 MAG: hypothetical protein A3K19_28555 [Lentisphaerae bacterium RIFOXYB12_FULL_65_16]
MSQRHIEVVAIVIYKCAGWDGAAMNGVYDLGEAFDDSNDNGVRDPDENFTDEDAVFCCIPTPIECSDQNAFVCNQGGSTFVGFDPGTYTLTTPQGGSGTINVLGVNVKFTDTAGTILNWQDEDLYGGLTPVNDELNPDNPYCANTRPARVSSASQKYGRSGSARPGPKQGASAGPRPRISGRDGPEAPCRGPGGPAPLAVATDLPAQVVNVERQASQAHSWRRASMGSRRAARTAG